MFPKALSKTHVLAIGGIIFLSLASLGRASEIEPLTFQPLMPLDPTSFLPQLPALPRDWKLTLSRAGAKFSSQYTPQSFAVRLYTYVPPPPPNGGTAAADTAKSVEFYLLDAAGDPEPFAAIHAQGAATQARRVRPLQVQGLAGIESQNGEETVATIQVSDRLVLMVKATHVSEEELNDWLDSVKYAGLARLSSASATLLTRSRLITVPIVNELKPGRGTITQMQYLTPEDRKKDSKLAPPPPT